MKMRMITHQPSTDDGSIMGMRHEFSPKKTTFGNKKKKNLVSASPIFLPLAKHDDQDIALMNSTPKDFKRSPHHFLLRPSFGIISCRMMALHHDGCEDE